MTLKEYLKAKQEAVNQDLQSCLPPVEYEARKLWESMGYTLFSDGKRIRPILMYAVYESLLSPGASSPPGKAIKATACAIEIVHASSLILDDFPSMDNSPIRRGKPANHITYGEAISLLAADALLTYAFELLSREVPGTLGLHLIKNLSQAVGTQGMIGGQVVDIESRGKTINYETLIYIHRHKTSALFEYAAKAGALIASANEKEMNIVVHYASNLGLAYQITDDMQDLLEENQSSGTLHPEVNFASLLGMEQARQKVNELIKEASQQLRQLPQEGTILRQMAEYVEDRIQQKINHHSEKK